MSSRPRFANTQPSVHELGVKMRALSTYGSVAPIGVKYMYMCEETSHVFETEEAARQCEQEAKAMKETHRRELEELKQKHSTKRHASQVSAAASATAPPTKKGPAAATAACHAASLTRTFNLGKVFCDYHRGDYSNSRCDKEFTVGNGTLSFKWDSYWNPRRDPITKEQRPDDTGDWFWVEEYGNVVIISLEGLDLEHNKVVVSINGHGFEMESNWMKWEKWITGWIPYKPEHEGIKYEFDEEYCEENGLGEWEDASMSTEWKVSTNDDDARPTDGNKSPISVLLMMPGVDEKGHNIDSFVVSITRK